MPIKISRYFLILISIFILSIFLPKFYWMLFDVNVPSTSVFFSSLDNEFTFISKGVYTDINGNKMLRPDYEKKMPLRFYRQLTLDNLMPDSIQNWEVDIKQLRRNQVYFRINASFYNKPEIQLFPLFESQSGRVNLENPAEYFRINKGMEFITASTNSINEKLTGKFTEALTKMGFQFPAKDIFGNPTTRKPFDEGYFVLDNNSEFYHIKMVKNKPFVKKIQVPDNVTIKSMKVLENNLKEFYGLVISEDSRFYFLSYDNYKFIDMHSEMTNYDHTTDQLIILCDVFHRTLIVNKDNGINALVTDRNYDIVDQYSKTWETKYELIQGTISNILFPFTTRMFSGKSYFSELNIKFSSMIIFFLNLILVLIIYMKNIYPGQRKEFTIMDYFDLLIVFFTGIYGFISVLVFNYKNKH